MSYWFTSAFSQLVVPDIYSSDDFESLICDFAEALYSKLVATQELEDFLEPLDVDSPQSTESAQAILKAELMKYVSSTDLNEDGMARIELSCHYGSDGTNFDPDFRVFPAFLGFLLANTDHDYCGISVANEERGALTACGWVLSRDNNRIEMLTLQEFLDGLLAKTSTPVAVSARGDRDYQIGPRNSVIISSRQGEWVSIQL